MAVKGLGDIEKAVDGLRGFMKTFQHPKAHAGGADVTHKRRLVFDLLRGKVGFAFHGGDRIRIGQRVGAAPLLVGAPAKKNGGKVEGNREVAAEEKNRLPGQSIKVSNAADELVDATESVSCK